MKLRSIFLILPLVCLSQACYEDNSNTSIKTVNPIVIDLGGAPTDLVAYSLDSLKVQPVVYKVGTPDAELSYRWEISTRSALNVSQLIGEKMELKAIVPVQANTVPYILTLTVTEEATGLQNFQQFGLTVNSDLGKGLLIADTNDGATSDLSLVMAKEFSQVTPTFDDRNTRLVRDIYSTINGAPLSEIVKGMISTVDARDNNNPRTLTVITDHHAYRMDPYVYELQLTDGQMFIISSIFNGMDEIHPTYIGTLDGPVYDHMIIDGKLYLRNAQWGEYLYKLNVETSDGSPYRATMATSHPAGRYYGNIAVYDEMNRRFLQLSGVGTNALRPMKTPTRPGGFDLNDLGEDFTALYMGAGITVQLDDWDNPQTVCAVMQAKSSGKRYLMTFFPSSNYYQDEYYAIKKYDLSQTAGFANSIAWECSPIENVFYYASPDKAYSMVLTGDNPVPTEVFTPEDGEKITGMMLWRLTNQGRIYIKNPSGSTEERSLINSGNRMMVISTYNESTGEGRITCVPIMYVGSGTLETDRNYHVVFDGFGRIVSLAHQPV